MAWQSPTVTVKWGSFFPSDAADEKLIVDTVVAATPHTTKRMRMEKLAPIFGIENIDAALDDLEGEQEADAERELAATTAALDAEARITGAGKAPADGPPGSGGSGGKPPSGKVNTGARPGGKPPAPTR